MKQLKKSGFSLTKLYFGDEKRQIITIPLFAILLSLIVGAVIILALGNNPITAYRGLLQGSGLLPKANYAGGKSMLTDFASFVNAWTPMLFAALAVCVALKVGLFNIGVAGQMLLGGFLATVIVGYSDMSSWLARPMVILVAALAGGFLGLIMGFLKHRFNINEVVTAIMLNYIVQYVVSFFINTRYIDIVSRQSRMPSVASRLTLSNYQFGDLKIDIPFGMVLALLTVFVLRFVLDKTTFGHELQTVGSNPFAARYFGVRHGRTMMIAMMISGALGGLAGATNYLGYFTSIAPGSLPSIGFDAVAVALLAGGNPVGAIFTSFLITVLSKGSIYMSSQTGLVSEISSVITGVVLLFSACGAYIQFLVQRSYQTRNAKKEG